MALSRSRLSRRRPRPPVYDGFGAIVRAAAEGLATFPMQMVSPLVSKSVCFLALTQALLAAKPSAGGGDVARGKTLFQQSCALCHGTGLPDSAPSGQGPLLAGIIGRPAASLPGFAYTKALREYGVTWDAAALDRFLTAPSALVPGTTMAVAVANPADRADLIAFLATLRPVALRPEPTAVAAGPRQRTPGDWQNDAPGARHEIRLDRLPAPYTTVSAGNQPVTVERPAGAKLAVPPGFTAELFASGLAGPRLLRTAPNGDVFIAETRSGRLRVVRTADGAYAPTENRVFADKLAGPFGIAFYPAADPRWIYVANLNSVVRFPYRSGDLAARGPATTVLSQLAESTGGHSTRDIAFSLDGRRMFVSVGSGSNVAEGMLPKTQPEIRAWESAHGLGAAWGYETNRADLLVTDPEGRGPLRVYAAGIRNAVGLAVQPSTGLLWVSTNERDLLGDDLVPDYISHVREGGFYGWPWYYLGQHEDPRHAGERPDLAGKAIVPDVPVQAHSASLEMTFYPADASGPAAFPREYRGNILAAFHGSWNRTGRTGSKVIRIRLKNGVPTGGYEDFLTGFVIDDSHVWGRPVGVAVAHDGALLVTDDAGDTLWRIAYVGIRPEPGR